MSIVHVNLGSRGYDIAIGAGGESLAAFVLAAYPRPSGVFVVSDENTAPHAERVAARLSEAGVSITECTIPAGETSKCLEMAARLYDDLAEMPADRRTLVMAVGGGVVGDLAGFASATYNRGLPLVIVPTSLLAMVDSSVGGKVGINHPRGKNLIGAFYQPTGVWIDTSELDTLPDREFLSGLAEVVKYGVILDADFFAYLESQADAILQRNPDVIAKIVGHSCVLKARIVEQDEREETGLRMVLNYGHTFGHVFEAIGGYGTWLHGEAVAAGMVCATRLAVLRGLIPEVVAQRQLALLQKFNLPTEIPATWPADELLVGMVRDKKTQAGKLRFVLPVRLGEVKVFDDVPEPDVLAVLRAP